MPCHSGFIVSENVQDSGERRAPWRDPLSIGWEAHRHLMLLRLRWHDTAARRRHDGPDRRHGLVRLPHGLIRRGHSD
jgi:hypothetical protein